MIAAMAFALSGCSGEVQAKLDDYLEELEFETPLDSVKEVQLGTHHSRSFFRISIPARKKDVRSRKEDALWVQLKFQLFVVVAPEHEKAVLAALERHRGMIDDVIGGICRKLAIEELDDPRLVTLKAKLIDSLRPLLGEERIMQIIFNDFQWEPL